MQSCRSICIRVRESNVSYRLILTGTELPRSARREIGGRWKLDLHRVPVDHVEKRVRIFGIIVAEALVDVEALGPDIPTP